MRLLFALLLLTTAFAPSPAQAQKDYPPVFDNAREETYKTVGDVHLKLWVFQPADHTQSDQRPAVVFFFGGGWKGGTPAQFEHHCRYLAKRGIVAITADYRVRSRHETLADKCVADGKSAVRWIRQNAARLGVDPDRIVAGGGSAGGHVAACTSVIKGLDEVGEDTSVSSVPNAVVLFNPALVIAQHDGIDLDEEKLADIATRTGVPPKELSPIEHIAANMPPTIIFHGEADTTVPFSTAKAFSELATKMGNRCELKGYAGAMHGFFNYGRGGTPGEHYRKTVRKMDEFLVSIGYLTGKPTMAIPRSRNVHLRSSMGNSHAVFTKTKQGNVAFIGGSITEMDGYRPMVMQYLESRFPDTDFTFTPAGISSTCSTTGAFRLDRDVLSAEPDLLLVEFAVNDDQDAGHARRECIRGMEGILRQALTHNPNMDIVVTHFVNPGMLRMLREGQQPVSSSSHEQVAAHYGVASNYLAAELADRVNDGTMTWKEFGGTHPKKPGNRLAADQVIDILDTAWADVSTHTELVPHKVPKTLDRNSYFRGRLVSVNQAKVKSGWTVQTPDWKSLPGGKRERYNELEMLCCDKPGAEFELEFSGSAVGAFLLAGPDAGILEVSIDGDEWQTINLYHRFSKSLHYPRTVMFATDLDRGKHKLIVRNVLDQNTINKGTAARLMEFVVD